ncbi:MAG TPA: hypothetical protein PLC38_09100 [Methanobacterium sp.]|nr:hypothetical protein [Methanobacterium sp.]
MNHNNSEHEMDTWIMRRLKKRVNVLYVKDNRMKNIEWMENTSILI